MFRKIINVLSTIVLVILIAVVVFMFIVRISGGTPSLFGYSVFRVSSGSMEPTLMTGDVILVKTTEPEDIHLGDIITYKGESGGLDGLVITHQVIQEPYRDGDTWWIQTQGIVEGSSPDPVITYEQVEGKFVSKISFLNKLYAFFLTPYGLIIFVFIILALFGYEIISLVLSYRALDEKDDDYYEPKPKKKSKKRKK